MTLPSVDLRPGANVNNAIQLLQMLAANCHNDALPVGNGHPVDAQNAYVKWTIATEGRLRTILSVQDASTFFSSPRHQDICSMAVGNQLIPMVRAEIEAQSDRFRRLEAELNLARNLFEGAGACLVPDTSFLIEHSKKIEEIDFHQLANTTGPVTVLMPIVIIDELDGLKRASNRTVRWRSGYSLAVIDRVIESPPWAGTLKDQEHLPPRGAVRLQAVLDPQGHQRMPINDDEIVNRCLACEPFSGDLTVLTYDTGQSTRAGAAGLKVNKLSQVLGEEPGT